MKKLMLICGVTLTLSTMAAASDIAFYVGPPNPGWYDAAAMAKDVDTIIAKTRHLFRDVAKFDDKQLAEFGAWVDARMDDGKLDIIWLNGTMPSCLYQFPNVNPDGSRAEKWLDGGNMLINVGDWFGYASYEGGVRSAVNSGTGAANILDLAAGIIVSAAGTTLHVTPAGKQYLPSITDPVVSDRPLVLSQVHAPWEVAAIFASTGGTESVTESRADPVVLHNTATGAYVAFINQKQPPGFPDRGLTCAEFIGNWVTEVIGLADPVLAGAPLPDVGAVDVPQDTALGWTPGLFAAAHDVYLGKTFADVNTATTAGKDLLVGPGQTEASYQPAAPLDFGTTYYWRVDEVNGAPDNTIFKGNVWSFTVEPYGYPIVPIAATASSYQTNMEPQKTIDGSGLAGDLHGTESSTMWMSTGASPNWIQYEFDRVYKLHQLLVWNSNQLLESLLGFGAKSVTIETSLDGATWTAVPDVPEFARAPGAEDYAANTTVNLGGAEAKYVKLTINTNWGGMAPPTGLAEVRFFQAPVRAHEPRPATDATDVGVDATLDWRPGREATSHTVYFGTDPNAVAQGTVAAKTLADHGYAPDSLHYGTTYYWKVDEVGTATYPGDVWNFTTQPYRVVEDFESYTDEEGHAIWQTWADGLENPANGGSLVGNDPPPYAEQTIIHGGEQSMPLFYNNTAAPYYSEAARTFDEPQDWTARGIKSLSLWFRGAADDTGQLYVKINGTKILYDGDGADLARTVWQPWNIDLSQAGKVGSVRSLAIGIEGTGAKGTLYCDDIRLYPQTPAYVTPAQPATTSLVAHYTFDEGIGTRVGDSSGQGNHGTANGNPQWVLGAMGHALQFDGTDDYVDCGNAASVTNVGSVSVAAWVKLAVTARSMKIASNQNNSTGGYKLGVYSSNSMVEFEIRNAAYVAILNRTAPGGTALQIDTWYHLVGVYEKGKALRTYVNGRLDRELLTTEVAGISNGNLMLGREAPTGAVWWNGQMDDVQVYNQALSDAEVAGLAGLPKPLHQPF